jgi:hypothetical protein
LALGFIIFCATGISGGLGAQFQYNIIAMMGAGVASMLSLHPSPPQSSGVD